jgi:hypothetical protein
MLRETAADLAMTGIRHAFYVPQALSRGADRDLLGFQKLLQIFATGPLSGTSRKCCCSGPSRSVPSRAAKRGQGGYVRLRSGISDQC